MNGIGLVVNILHIRTSVCCSILVIVVIGVRILQTLFTRGSIIRKGVGYGGGASVVILRIYRPDGLQRPIDILLIDDAELVLKTETRNERIYTVLDTVFLDTFIVTG